MPTELKYLTGKTQPWSIKGTQPAKDVVLHSWSETKIGTSIPGFRRLITLGHEAGSRYSSNTESHSVNCAAISQTTWQNHPVSGQPYNFVYREGLIQPPMASFLARSSGAATKARDMAAAKLSGKVRDAKVEFEGPTFLGELSETVKMIRRPAAGIYPLVKAYIRAAKGIRPYRGSGQLGARRHLDALRDLYLEATFGWMPLLSDVDSAAKALAELRIVESPRLSAKATVEVPGSTTTFPGGLGPFTGNVIQVRGARITAHAYCRLRSEIVGSTARGVTSSYWGFSPSNFVPTVWNLLPWSFVIDYFTNVNELITSACYPPHVDSVYSGITVFEDYYTNCTDTYKAVDQPRSITVGGMGHWEAHRFYFERYVGVPTPSLHLNFPRAKQIINIAALLDSIDASRRM